MVGICPHDQRKKGDQTGVLNSSFSPVPDLFEDITLPDRQAVVRRRPTRSFNRWAVTPLHTGSLLLHKQLLFIKTASRLCLCRRGLLVDDPPSVQAEVGRREGAHRRWPDSRQRVHRTIPGRNETSSVSRDPPPDSQWCTKRHFLKFAIRLEIQRGGNSRKKL